MEGGGKGEYKIMKSRGQAEETSWYNKLIVELMDSRRRREEAQHTEVEKGVLDCWWAVSDKCARGR